MVKPLEGIRVADFSWVATGPLATKTLADFGAEVIRIESRNRPDILRTIAPLKDGIAGLNRGGQYNRNNPGKLSLAVNLTHPKGVILAKKLISKSDVVIENFGAGVIKRMGLGYEEIKKVNENVIMISSSVQGQTGPHSDSRGFGTSTSALAGFNQISGWPDRPPIGLGVYTDFIAKHFVTIAILTALDYRRRTGKGQYIDHSQYETGVHFLTPLVLDFVANGRVANRMGNRSSFGVPHGVYRCKGEERWCAIAVYTDQEWLNFCKVIGCPELASDQKFNTFVKRKENEDELDKLVESYTANISAEELMSTMQEAGVSAGVLQTGKDLLEKDAHLKQRHLFWKLDHPEIGEYYAPGAPFVLSKYPCELRSAPLIGEHNEYVLKKILEMTDEEIAELVIEGTAE